MTAADSPNDPVGLPAEALTAAPSPAMERLAAGAIVLLGLAVIVGARAIALRNETGGIDPRWWPTAIGAGIFLTGVWMMIDALRQSIARDVAPAQRSGWLQMAVTVVALIVVLVLWHFRVGFIVLGPAYLLVLNWVYGLRNWKSLLLFPVVIGAVLYLLFQVLLRVPL